MVEAGGLDLFCVVVVGKAGDSLPRCRSYAEGGCCCWYFGSEFDLRLPINESLSRGLPPGDSVRRLPTLDGLMGRCSSWLLERIGLMGDERSDPSKSCSRRRDALEPLEPVELGGEPEEFDELLEDTEPRWREDRSLPGVAGE